MKKIWSENENVNIAVNGLLFLTAINFLHYGQLFLPLICMILFIDNRFEFKVNDPRIFILLCLFAVSFYGFSYQLGFYSVMGFMLPMAYYIGSNVRCKNEENVKKLIYLLSFSMAMHVVLNAVYELIVHGTHGFFYSSSHYDIWVGDKVNSTLIAIDIDLLLAGLYHLVFHEKEKTVRKIGLFIFCPAMFYLVVIGRRTQCILLILLFFASFIYESFFLKTNDQNRKRQFLTVFSVLLGAAVLVFAAYAADLFGAKTFMDELRIIQKLKMGLINDERVDVFFDTIGLMPKYLSGGQKISAELGLQAHNFWLDIYDYAGIMPFLLMIVYTFHCISVFFKILSSRKLSDPFKILSFSLALCFLIQFNVEPVMTGASIFLIMTVTVMTFLGGLINE
ncbi:MAG: hypothetical protein K5648_04885 [Erysipelotrichaceae bacterium]|nr:hypothetical protein [Erysipelotrichaceae bacterium]